MRGDKSFVVVVGVRGELIGAEVFSFMPFASPGGLGGEVAVGDWVAVGTGVALASTPMVGLSVGVSLTCGVANVISEGGVGVSISG